MRHNSPYEKKARNQYQSTISKHATSAPNADDNTNRKQAASVKRGKTRNKRQGRVERKLITIDCHLTFDLYVVCCLRKAGL